MLGVKTRQLNHDFTYPTGVTDNELRTWNHLGLFTASFKESELGHFAALAAARRYQPQPGGSGAIVSGCQLLALPSSAVVPSAYFDARYDTPLDRQGLIDGP